MKKLTLLAIAMLILAGLAIAQTAPDVNNPPTTAFKGGAYGAGATGGIPFNIDKLGAHQNGGRGCVGCHAPHSGARGNGGVLKWNSTTKAYDSVAVVGDVGEEVLWGQDLGPIYNTKLNFPTSGDYAAGVTGDVTITEAMETTSPRMISGVAMCLSCHDGNVAKGAMMANKSFEQAAKLLPAGYGSQPIPTLLGAEGDTYGNYSNDHPVGQQATLGAVGHGAIAKAKGFFDIGLSGTTKVVVKAATFPGSTMAYFENNYGLPTITGARAGAGFAIDPTETNVDKAYVVCTTCHTPHSMYTASLKGNTYPSYFFIAAPYNPGADTAGGTKASSATQFCRQCHFSGPGGANEASGISIPTAF